MPTILLKRFAYNGGRFDIYIDGIPLGDNCNEILVNNEFQLCVKEYKVFSNTKSFKQEVLDIMLRRGWRTNGSWDDIYPPNYTIYRCNISLFDDAVIEISMKRFFRKDKYTVFDVKVRNGQIRDENTINGLTESEFEKCRKFSIKLYKYYAILFLSLLILLFLIGGISATVFTGIILSLIFLVFTLSDCRYLNKLRTMVFQNTEKNQP